MFWPSFSLILFFFLPNSGVSDYPLSGIYRLVGTVLHLEILTTFVGCRGTFWDFVCFFCGCYVRGVCLCVCLECEYFFDLLCMCLFV